MINTVGIIGIVLGSIFAVVLLAAVIYFLVRHRERDERIAFNRHVYDSEKQRAAANLKMIRQLNAQQQQQPEQAPVAYVATAYPAAVAYPTASTQPVQVAFPVNTVPSTGNNLNYPYVAGDSAPATGDQAYIIGQPQYYTSKRAPQGNGGGTTVITYDEAPVHSGGYDGAVISGYGNEGGAAISGYGNGGGAAISGYGNGGGAAISGYGNGGAAISGYGNGGAAISVYGNGGTATPISNYGNGGAGYATATQVNEGKERIRVAQNAAEIPTSPPPVAPPGFVTVPMVVERDL